MKIILILLFIGNILTAKDNKAINFYKKTEYKHFKFDCYADTTKLIEKNNYKVIVRLENTIGNMGTYCNAYWLVEDKRTNKYFIIRNTSNYLKDMKKYNYLKSKYIIFYSSFQKKLKKLSKRSDFYDLKWWIYKKEINKKDYIYVEKELAKINVLKLEEYCHLYSRVHDNRKSFTEYYKNKVNNYSSISFDGRITFTYPKFKSVDFLLTRRMSSNSTTCNNLEKLIKFIINKFENEGDISFQRIYDKSEIFLKKSLRILKD